MENNIIELKVVKEDDFQVEFSVIPENEIMIPESSFQIYAQNEIDKLDEELSACNKKIEELNDEIDRLTNHADGLDYAIAVSSGILCGIIDSLFVGEWDFQNAKAISNEQINKKVTEFAKKDPDYFEWLKKNRSPDRKDADKLDNAIDFLEKKYHLPGDGEYNNPLNPKINDAHNITHKTHRLDDLCHHPTLVGLICCIIVQFTGYTVYSDKTSTTVRLPVTVNTYGNFVGHNPITKLFAGIINWFITIAQTMANRKGHLMSDMATPAGIPGPFLSTLKELSALPAFKDTSFADNLRKAFQNGIGTGKKQIDLGVLNSLFEGADSKFDLRTEGAIKHELKRQAVPVIINEVIIRAFYFIRQFAKQLQSTNDLSQIDWKKVLPINNRTIARMLTISTGTFVAVDLADAAIRSAVKSNGNAVAFGKNVILRVNFVGIGRFFVAVATDIKMGIERNQRRYDRMFAYNQMFLLATAKIYYRQAQIQDLLGTVAEQQQQAWIQLQKNEQSLEEMFREYEAAIKQFLDAYLANQKSMERIGKMCPRIEEKNPGLISDILDTLDEI